MSNAGRIEAIERKLLAVGRERKENCFDLLDREGEFKIVGAELKAVLKLKANLDTRILALRELKLFLRSTKTRKNALWAVSMARQNGTLPCLEDCIFGFLRHYGNQCDFKSQQWKDGSGMSNINDFMQYTYGDLFSRRGEAGYHKMYRLFSQGLHSLFGGDEKFGGHVRFAMPDGTVFDSDRPVNYNAKVGKNKCAIISALYGFLFGSGYIDSEIRHFMGSHHFTLRFISAFACVVTQINWEAVTIHPIMYCKV